ncbi:MAG TPA: D-hexose-6-phosphate mutarotase [Longimicrobium sp.]|nr:D-hexose-6-phosphate mutarotase [Longimicrobium sp.]
MATGPKVTEERDDRGLPVVVLTHPRGGRATVHRHGAHVTRWTDASGDDVLFLSAASRFGEGAAIRGGIPVIFPQFAEQGPLPKHGFARTSEWALVDTVDAEDEACAVFQLTDTPATHAVWDHAFRAEVAVVLADALTVVLSVENTGEAPFEFTCALHGYLRVDDARRAAVDGLRGVRFRDKVAGGEAVQEEDELRFAGEVDRVYLGATPELRLRDGDGHTTTLRARGFPDAVVWNPGPELAAKLEDLEEDGWRRFVCVEAGQVGTPVRLKPGERWSAAQTIARG